MLKLTAIMIILAGVIYGGSLAGKAGKLAMDKKINNIEKLMDNIDNVR